jgi:hypothetical protein
MKIRNGFVSNSSSSSFVIAGLKVSNELLTDEMREELYDSHLIMDDEGPEGYTIIGEALADVHSDESYLDFHHFTLEKIGTMIDDVEKLTGLTGERGVFTGTRSC